MSELTPHQYKMGRQVGAAELIHEAKCKEHQAACLLSDQRIIEHARSAVFAASEALLDARERLYRSLPRA